MTIINVLNTLTLLQSLKLRFGLSLLLVVLTILDSLLLFFAINYSKFFSEF